MQEPRTKDYPQSLRIPPDLSALANEIAAAMGETQLSKVLIQALAIGLPALAASLSPDDDGKLAGKEPALLAKVLRRKLASAVDLMIEHGQLPVVALAATGLSPTTASSALPSPRRHEGTASGEGFSILDSQMGDDLEDMGFAGMSLSAALDT
jgi:hypothetical protein